MALHSFHIGGCELQLLSLCREILQHGFEPIILYSSTKGSFHPKRDGNLQFFHIPKVFYFTRLIPLYLKFLFGWKLKRLPDLFHCHGYAPFAEQIVEYARDSNIPTIVKFTTDGEVTSLRRGIENKIKLADLLSQRSFKRSRLEKYLFGKNRLSTVLKVDRFVCINPTILSELLRFPIDRNKLIQIPNGVDVNRFKPVAAAEKDRIKISLGLSPSVSYILCAARFVERKRIGDLIEAWAAIEAFYPTRELVLVGDGELRSELAQLVRKLNIQRRVVFPGMKESLELYYQSSDLFVFPSSLEGLPNVILEAMSTALPVIATAISGIQELIQSGVNGVLFTPTDIQGLIASIRYVFEHPLEASRMGKAARETILLNYSFDKIGPRFASFYRNLMSAAFPSSDI